MATNVVQIPTFRNEEWQLEEIDIIFRAIGNSHISHVYFRLYTALIDRWPEVLTGNLVTDFQAWELRERAGWPSKESTTKFLSDLKAVGAILEYDPGKHEKDKDGHDIRLGSIRGNPDMMPYPEGFRLSETDQRKKERDAQRNRDAQRALILNCAVCNSPDIKYDLVPICKKCGHKHPAIINIPVNRLSITPEPDTFMDDFTFDEPTPTSTPATPAARQDTEPIQQVQPQVIPHCKHWQCLNGPNRTQWKLSGYYCPVHKGMIDEEGKPI